MFLLKTVINQGHDGAQFDKILVATLDVKKISRRGTLQGTNLVSSATMPPDVCSVEGAKGKFPLLWDSSNHPIRMLPSIVRKSRGGCVSSDVANGSTIIVW